MATQPKLSAFDRSLFRFWCLDLAVQANKFATKQRPFWGTGAEVDGCAPASKIIQDANSFFNFVVQPEIQIVGDIKMGESVLPFGKIPSEGDK